MVEATLQQIFNHFACAYRMIQRRVKAAGHRDGDRQSYFPRHRHHRLPEDSGKLEVAQHIANHESPRTTKLYDRRQDEISLDEIERITI
jgi:integrase/recombinase XerD